MSLFEQTTLITLIILGAIDFLLTIPLLIKSSTRAHTALTSIGQVVIYIVLAIVIATLNLSVIPACTLVGIVVVGAGYSKIDALLINRGSS